MSDLTALTQAMNEYAQAIRGDWSMFDGRCERDVIEGWVSEIQSPNPDHTIEWWRNDLNLCLAGGGHWCGPWGHCEAGDSEWHCNCPCTVKETR